MNKDKYEKVRQDFDEIIKMSIDEELKEIDDMPIPTNEEMLAQGYTLPPEGMYKKILVACKEKEEKIKPMRHKKKKWKKIVLIAALIAALFGAMNANAVKMFIFKTINQITYDAIRIRGVNEVDYKSTEVNDEEAYENVEKRLGRPLQKPHYLPEGMTFDSIEIFGNKRAKIDYADANGKCIKISAVLYSEDASSGRTIDTTGGETGVENISDKSILFAYFTRGTGEKWISATWNDGNMVYEINTNINKNDLIKVIEEFK